MSTSITRPFNYDLIPEGFYHQVAERGTPIRRAWHLQKFERVIDCLPNRPNQSILDIGCFAGTFLSLLPKERFSHQVGVDIIAKQIEYANREFKTDFRTFKCIPHMGALNTLNETFDCVTLIEVIEHLEDREIQALFEALAGLVKSGGRLVLSTPNYASCWPLLEIILNRVSEVSYVEQHVNKFNYFTVERAMERIYPSLPSQFKLRFKTTTHFCSPFLAWISLGFAARVSRLFPHHQWRFPLGNLILLEFERI